MKYKLFPLVSILLIVSLVICGAVSAKRMWSQTRPQINLTHIFQGEINRHGKPTGFHSRPGGVDPKGARLKKIMSRPNTAGVYTARIEIWDPRERRWKEKFSSFFPDEMNEFEVIGAILHAYEKREKGASQPWRGPSGNGFRVQGYVTGRGGINTAFPVYRKD